MYFQDLVNSFDDDHVERNIGSKRELGFKTDGRESKGYVECTRLGGRAWFQYELNRDGGLEGWWG